MRKLRLMLSAILLIGTSFVWAQTNCVMNPDFELGPVPSGPGQITAATGWSQPCTDPYMFTSGGTGADLMDRNSPSSAVDIPNNSWGILDERDGDDRYAHLFQTENAFTGAGGAAETKGERITGTLTKTLEAGCYDVSFWGAVEPHDLTIEPGIFVDFNPITILDINKQIIEVLLVSGNNCTGLLLFETTPMPDDGIWHQYSNAFTLSGADAGVYDRILFRVKDDGNPSANQFSIFLDEVELVNSAPVVSISGNPIFCANETEQLCATAGFDNYLWSNGATTQCITVTTGGTFDVEAWNNGDECHGMGSIEMTLLPALNIKIPKIISVCNENFQQLCGPAGSLDNPASWSWYFNDPVTMTSILVGSGQCFTPSQYGSYTLVVTSTFCDPVSSTFIIQEGTGPEITIKDVIYCDASPALIGLIGPYSDAISYTWTYNGGTPFSGGHQIPNMGDGEYCVTIAWSDANVPGLLGCESTTCFEVKQICEPEISYCFDDCIFTFTPDLVVSSGITVTYLWDFGNGNTSTDMNPTWHFQNYGVNVVTVTFFLDDGNSVTPIVHTFSVFNNCEDEDCDVNANFSFAQVGISNVFGPRHYIFTNLSSYGPAGSTISYEWTVTQNGNPYGTFSTPGLDITIGGGKYQICLKVTVTNPNGVICTDEYCRKITIPKKVKQVVGPKKNFMKVNPNPSNGKFNVVLDENVDNGSKVNIRVKNMQGVEVLNETHLGGKQFQVDIRTEPSGIYMVQIRYENERLTEKVVVQ